MLRLAFLSPDARVDGRVVELTTRATRAAQRALSDRRRSQRRPRHLRRSSQDSQRRRAGGARRAASTAPTPSSRCAARAARRSSPAGGRTRPACWPTPRAIQCRPHSVRTSRGRHAAAVVPETATSGAHRQALSLRRAGQIGTSSLDDYRSWDLAINPRGHDREAHDRIITFSRASSAARSAGSRPRARDAEQTDGIDRRRGRPAAGASRTRTSLLPGRRLLPAAHAVRRAEEVFRPVPARHDHTAEGAGRGQTRGARAGVRGAGRNRTP